MLIWIINFLRRIYQGHLVDGEEKNVIKRNAIIKLHNEGENIERYKGDSPYINEYIERLK